MNKILQIEDIEDGMIIDKPIYRDNGTLLVPGQTMVTHKLRYLLIHYGIFQASIKDSSNEVIEVDTEAMRETIAIKIFNKEMEEVTENIKSRLLKFRKEGKSINLGELLKEILKLFNVSHNNIQLINMMYCMSNHNNQVYVHSINVATMCKIMAKWLKFNEEDTRVLVLSGLLHDIGKLEVPQEIIEKVGDLTPREKELYNSHPYLGYIIVKDLIVDNRVKRAVYEHHERCDGTGYPDSLKEDQISDFSKIISIIDTYDTMITDKGDKKGVCPFKVIDILINEGYKKYDTKYLVTFLEKISETYINRDVHLSTGETGRIIMINKNDLSRPLVKVGDEFIDLSKEREITIEVIL